MYVIYAVHAIYAVSAVYAMCPMCAMYRLSPVFPGCEKVKKIERHKMSRLGAGVTIACFLYFQPQSSLRGRGSLHVPISFNKLLQ